jgi:hypothetical protein
MQGGSIPGATYEGEFVEAKWDGHAWVMLAGVLFDLSYSRSAYATKTPSNFELGANTARTKSDAGFTKSLATRSIRVGH